MLLPSPMKALCTFPFSIRGSVNKSFTAQTEKQASCVVILFGWRIHSTLKFLCMGASPFFKILITDYLANKSQFAGLIWQITSALIKSFKVKFIYAALININRSNVNSFLKNFSKVEHRGLPGRGYNRKRSCIGRRTKCDNMWK